MDDLLDWFGSQDRHDVLEVAARSHKVAGSAAVFGAVALRDTLKSIEAAAKTGDTAALQDKMTTLPDIWAKTRRELL